MTPPPPRLVLDDNGHVQPRGQVFGQNPQRDIRRRAGSEGRDNADAV
jgi:hypothetical protein